MYELKNGVVGEYFYGNKISDYGIECGFVDYATLSKAFDCVLNNSIYSAAWDLGDWEQVSGFGDNLEDNENEYSDYEPEIYQYYIVSDSGADILKDVGEIVFYHYELDVYLWGVTHWGTSWDYVLTNIPCNKGHEILND